MELLNAYLSAPRPQLADKPSCFNIKTDVFFPQLADKLWFFPEQYELFTSDYGLYFLDCPELDNYPKEAVIVEVENIEFETPSPQTLFAMRQQKWPSPSQVVFLLELKPVSAPPFKAYWINGQTCNNYLQTNTSLQTSNHRDLVTFLEQVYANSRAQFNDYVISPYQIIQGLESHMYRCQMALKHHVLLLAEFEEKQGRSKIKNQLEALFGDDADTVEKIEKVEFA